MPAVRPLGTAVPLPAAAPVLLSTAPAVAVAVVESAVESVLPAAAPVLLSIAPAVAVAVVESGVESVLESCEEERENRGSRTSSNSTAEEMVLLQYVASRNVNVT
jgi:hypothetical protein